MEYIYLYIYVCSRNEWLDSSNKCIFLFWTLKNSDYYSRVMILVPWKKKKKKKTKKKVTIIIVFIIIYNYQFGNWLHRIFLFRWSKSHFLESLRPERSVALYLVSQKDEICVLQWGQKGKNTTPALYFIFVSSLHVLLKIFLSCTFFSSYKKIIQKLKLIIP